MIVRTWVAYARPGNARAYREHLKGAVLPRRRFPFANDTHPFLVWAQGSKLQ